MVHCHKSLVIPEPEIFETKEILIEAIKHGGIANSAKVEIVWVESRLINNKDDLKVLEDVDGILVPGGFGKDGTEGKILAIQYAREHKIPYLGICLGMQMAVVEFARNVLNLKDADSIEFNPNTQNPVIHIMEEQKGITNKGGTMRLGAYKCILKENTKAKAIYQKTEVNERHRHRFEYNNDYKEMLENAGLKCSGVSPDGSLVEIVELENHPYFIAAQFHPELKSRPNRPAPLFVGLVEATKNKIL